MTDIPISYLGNDQWRVDIEVIHIDKILGVTLTVPSGYVTDLASVPRILWPLLASFELSILAPVIHDLIYGFNGDVPGTPRHITRREADDLFYRLMRQEGIDGILAWEAWAAVRAFGWTLRRF